MRNDLYTCECVTIGHPDKLCDIISDSVLDAYLEQDPDSRVACECAVKDNKVWVFGEVTSKADVDIPAVVRKVHDFVGYPSDNLDIRVDLSRQSPDIAMGVDTGGAGDQGMMWGYACRETDTMMPLACKVSRNLCDRLTELRKDGTLPWLRPDGKAQVTVRYENGKLLGIEDIVLSTQHSETIDIEDLRVQVAKKVIVPVLNENDISNYTIKFHINPTGKFVVGGAYGDSGLTGRKIVVDQYGSYCEVGGGAFSGKDSSKVDRSAAYMARQIAKRMLGFYPEYQECKVMFGFAIGVAHPVSANIIFDDIVEPGITKKWEEVLFTYTPQDIIKTLDLKQPVFASTAIHGHFGYLGHCWEQE